MCGMFSSHPCTNGNLTGRKRSNCTSPETEEDTFGGRSFFRDHNASNVDKIRAHISLIIIICFVVIKILSKNQFRHSKFNSIAHRLATGIHSQSQKRQPTNLAEKKAINQRQRQKKQQRTSAKIRVTEVQSFLSSYHVISPCDPSPHIQQYRDLFKTSQRQPSTTEEERGASTIIPHITTPTTATATTRHLHALLAIRDDKQHTCAPHVDANVFEGANNSNGDDPSASTAFTLNCNAVCSSARPTAARQKRKGGRLFIIIATSVAAIAFLTLTTIALLPARSYFLPFVGVAAQTVTSMPAPRNSRARPL